MADTLAEAIVKLQVDNKALAAGLDKAQQQITGLVKKSESSFGGLGATIKRLGPIIAATFGARELVNFAKNTTATAAQFQQAMANVSAITGAVGKDFQDMTNLARDMGATTVFTATQSAEALQFLGMAGLNASDSMRALPGILNLAAAGSIDIATAADLATNVLGGMGLKVDQLNRVNDVMANTASKSNTSILELAGALRIAGPVAAATGESIEQVSAVLGGLANQGIKAETAGQAYKQMLSRLITAANGASDALDENGESIGKAQAALAKYNIQLKDANGEMIPFIDILKEMKDKNIDAAAAQDIFGRFTFSSALAAKTAADAMADLAEKNDRAAGSAERMARIKLDTFTGDVTILASAWEALQISLAGAITEADTGRAIIRALTDTVGALTQSIDEGSGAFGDNFRVAIEVSAIAINNLIKVMNGLLFAANEVWNTFKIAFNAVSLIVVGSVDNIIKSFVAMLDGMKELPLIGKIISKDAGGGLKEFGKTISNLKGGIIEASKESIRAVADIGVSALNTADTVDTITENLFANLMGARNKDVKGFKKSETEKKDAAKSGNNAIAKDTQKTAAENYEAYREYAEKVSDEIEGIAELNKALSIELSNIEAGATQSKIDDINRWADEMKKANGDVELINKITAARIAKVWQDAWKNTPSYFTDIFTKIGEVINEVLGDTGIKVVKTFMEAFDGISSAVSLVFDSVSSILDMAGSIGGMVVSGLQGLIALPDRLTDAANSLLNTMETFPETLDKFITDFPELLNQLIEMAPEFIDKLISGLPKMIDMLLAQLPRVVNLLVKEFPRVVEVIISKAPEIMNSIIKELPRLIAMLAKELPKLILLLVEAIPQVVQALVDNIEPIINAFITVAIALIDKLIEIMPTLIPAIIQLAFKFVIAIIKKLPDIIKVILAAIPIIIKEFVKLLPDLITAIIDAIPEIILAFIEGVPDIIMALVEAAPKIIEALVTLAPKLIMKLIEKIPEFITALGDQMWDAFKDIPDMLWEAIKKLFDFRRIIPEWLGGGGTKLTAKDGSKTGGGASGARTSGAGSGGGTGGGGATINTQQFKNAIIEAVKAAGDIITQAAKTAGNVFVDGTNTAGAALISNSSNAAKVFVDVLGASSKDFINVLSNDAWKIVSAMSDSVMIFVESLTRAMQSPMEEMAIIFGEMFADRIQAGVREVMDGLGMLAENLRAIIGSIPKGSGSIGGGTAPFTPFNPGFSNGGLVGGNFNGMSGIKADTVNARLTPGEFVMPRMAVNSTTLPILENMRNGNGTSSAAPAINITVQGSIVRESDLYDSIENELSRRLKLEHA